MQTKYGAICILTFAILLNGCVNPYSMREIAFVEPTPPAEDETLVYVFREDTSFGGARKFAIICNDTVVGVLTPGTFCSFKVKSGENEIVAYISPSPIMHYRIQNRAGKTTYLFCRLGYTTGSFIEEIDKAQANEFMKKFKFTDIELKNQKAKMNYKDYYDGLFK
jgi:hypothetical protein